MNVDTGGPAYPCKREMVPTGDNREPYEVVMKGMTLLDYFAGHAMQGMMVNVKDSVLSEEIADECYNIAKAMIAEKRRRENESA